MPVPQEEVKTEEAQRDAFGQPLKKEEILPEKPGEKKQEEQKKEEVDISKDPRVIALLAERDKKIEDQSEQLSGQGKAIREINKKLKALGHKESTVEEKPDLPHKQIKRSKDLTDSERDEKTQDELRLMDQLADAQERENKAAEEAHKAKVAAAKKAAEDAGGDDEDDEDDEDKKKRGKASEPKAMIDAEIETLSGGDAEKKRELKEAAKLISFEGLKTKEEYAARLKLAAEKFIPKWTPPKEQVSPSGGKPVEGGGAAADDPHDVMKFVKSARDNSAGGYAL
jgi:hypothetical protein